MVSVSSRLIKFLIPRLVRHVPGLDSVSPSAAQPAARPRLPNRPVSAQDRAADADLRLMAGLRADLYRVEEVAEATAENSPEVLRWSAAVLNIILVLVALPVGVALMIHGSLRGADLAVSGRAMALTGMLLGVMQVVNGLNGAI
ncbi:hypothetical protein [Gemmobacter denitrificans]|uniref:Uncharacterized protein n=1 Tax=Gemmobacter denitrificans TaxID=3123040 RepID=A0ABU8BWQ3_9RHOB